MSLARTMAMLAAPLPGATLEAFRSSTAFVRALLGPFAGGAATACRLELLRLGRRAGVRTRWAVIAATLDGLMGRAIPAWFDLVPEDTGDWSERARTNTLPVIDGGGREVGELEVVFLALDQVADRRRIGVMELTGAWLERARAIADRTVLADLVDTVGEFPSALELARGNGGQGAPAPRGGILISSRAPLDGHWLHRVLEIERPEGYALFRQPSALGLAAENLANLPRGFYPRLTGKPAAWVRVNLDNEYGTAAGVDSLVPEALRPYAKDPVRFVLERFPWGRAGTELAAYVGPDAWAVEILERVRDGLLAPDEAIRIAIASGHGIGKSALIAWLVLWAISTKVNTRGVVTAGKESQLRTKTWAELGKWFRLGGFGEWFSLTASTIASSNKDYTATWRIDAVAWSAENPEAFAGMHNQGSRILMIFDEAPAIADVIWQTTEGALTDADTEIIWFVAGNATRNSGRFRECFGKLAARWFGRQIDSRTVKITNKKQIQEWVDDYGEDSDFVRARVRGVFPRAGDMQFIPSDRVAAAMKREAKAELFDPLVAGVDVARFGLDKTVIRFRKGRDGRSIAPIKLRGVDNITIANRIQDLQREMNVDAWFVDSGGGAGVIDYCRRLGMRNVFEIHFGGKPDRIQMGEEHGEYANKRAEMYGNCRDWLKVGAIDEDLDLEADLTNVQYGFVTRDGRDVVLLESKTDMKRRGLASPDDGDALVLTFAYPVTPHQGAGRPHAGVGGDSKEFDPIARELADSDA